MLRRDRFAGQFSGRRKVLVAVGGRHPPDRDDIAPPNMSASSAANARRAGIVADQDIRRRTSREKRILTGGGPDVSCYCRDFGALLGACLALSPGLLSIADEVIEMKRRSWNSLRPRRFSSGP